MPDTRGAGRPAVFALVAIVATVVMVSLVEPPRDARAVSAVPLNSCASSDHGAPVVHRLTVDRARVDVRRTGRAVVVDAIVGDTGGPGSAVGVAQATAFASLDDAARSLTGSMRRLEGDHWRGVLRFPRGSRPGVWTVGVVPVDAGGLSPQSFEGSPSAVEAAVRVVAHEDKHSPVATAVRMFPGRVDVRDSRRRVRVTVEARDANSGVRSVQLSLTRDAETAFAIRQADLHRVDGTARAGTWRGHIDMPRSARRGWWTADLALVDRTGHARSYHSDNDGPTADPPGLRPLRVLSPRDGESPRVTAVEASASAIDVRSAPATVSIQARIRDAGSGVRTATAWMLRGAIHVYQVPLHLVSGTRRDGLWRGSWTATTCQVPAGTLGVSVAVSDRAGNRQQSEGLAPSLDVRNDDHTGPWIAQSELTSSLATLVFSEDVYGISQGSALLRDPEADAGTPAISGHWECATTAGAAVDCGAGPVRTARFHPDSPFPAAYLRVLINPEHVLDVTDESGNPYVTVATSIGYPPRS